MSFLIYVPPLLLGYLIADAIWPTAALRQNLLKIFLGPGIGLGVTSLLFFIWLLVNHQLTGFKWLLAGLVVAGILVEIYRYRNRWTGIRKAAIHFTPTWIGLTLTVAFAVSLLLAYSSFVLYSETHPHGDRDAQAIWNLRARVIFRDVANWQQIFSPDFETRFHSDYPLLVPLSVVWGWDAVRTETTKAPMAVSGIFMFGMVGLLFTSLMNLRTWGQASLASLVLIGTPFFAALGTFQTADVPFSYFVLSTIVLFAMHGLEEDGGPLILAGLTAGLSAWTKNEGLLFVLASLIGCALYGLRQRHLWKTLRLFMMGLLAPVIITLFFKVALAPPTDLSIGLNFQGILGRLASLQRYEILLAAIGSYLLNLGNWQLSIVIVLAIFSIVVGIQLERSQRKVAAVCTLILAVQFLGYFFTYAVTTIPLEFLLKYSLDRLLFHLFPASLFLFFWIINAPETLAPYRIKSIPQESH